MRRTRMERNKDDRMLKVFNIMVVLFFALLLTCTAITTIFALQIKTMVNDSFDVLNDIHVYTDEIREQTVIEDPNEDLISYYSQYMPVEYCLHIIRTCEQYDINPREIFAIIERESGFDPGAVSGTADYGLMQLNHSNIPALKAAFGDVDLMDPYQNIEAGIYWYAGIKAQGHGSIEKDLMVYNMGSRGAERKWSQGIYSTEYSRGVLEVMR